VVKYFITKRNIVIGITKDFVMNASNRNMPTEESIVQVQKEGLA
jgi:hypothetical protein